MVVKKGKERQGIRNQITECLLYQKTLGSLIQLNKYKSEIQLPAIALLIRHLQLPGAYHGLI